jgi:uncharacterized membrane protein YjdF
VLKRLFGNVAEILAGRKVYVDSCVGGLGMVDKVTGL